MTNEPSGEPEVIEALLNDAIGYAIQDANGVRGAVILHEAAWNDAMTRIRTLAQQRDAAVRERDADVRWLREMLADYRIAYDDHTAGRRVALNTFIHDLRARLAACEREVTRLNAIRELDTALWATVENASLCHKCRPSIEGELSRVAEEQDEERASLETPPQDAATTRGEG